MIETMESVTTPHAGEAKSLPPGMILTSKTNPRRSMNPEVLAELTESVRRHGILQPLLVRPYRDQDTEAESEHLLYELVAGHRRLEAARAAALEHVPVMVRELNDTEVLEIQLVENLQRADLHPLEEAEGYQRLTAVAKYDVARIAARVGRSIQYVYDRLKLLALSKEARELFLADTITAGHAILLARLKAADQARAIKATLFQRENGLFDPEDENAGRVAMKICSVRELSAWIDQHVRFGTEEPDPMLFPETAARLAVAKKAVPITYGHYVQEDARDGRTFTEQSWRRADGEKDSKTCEFAVLGYVAAGAGRGRAFDVCVSKDKCTIHWGSERRARAKKSRERASRPATTDAKNKVAPSAAEQKRIWAAHDASRKLAAKAVRDAVLAKAASASPSAFLRMALRDSRWDVRAYLEREGKITGRSASDKAVEAWFEKATDVEIQRAFADEIVEGGHDDHAADQVFGVGAKAIFERFEKDAEKALRSEPAKPAATPKAAKKSAPAKPAAASKVAKKRAPAKRARKPKPKKKARAR